MAIFGIKFVVLYTDALLYLLLFVVLTYAIYAQRHEHLLAPWRRLAKDSVAMGSLAVLIVYLLIGLADSIHFRLAQPIAPLSANTEQSEAQSNTQQPPTDTPAVPDKPQNNQTIYSAEVLSLLDVALQKLRDNDEKTYSAPLATHLYAKETIEQNDGSVQRDYPRLKFGGAHLDNPEHKTFDIVSKATVGILIGQLWALLLLALLALRHAKKYAQSWSTAVKNILLQTEPDGTRWRAFWLCSAIMLCIASMLWHLSSSYHVFGTDKIGQDVLYQALKSIRTGLLIGTLTTLVMLPFAIFMGIAAGYFRGWLDDVIQYIYTTLNSIPGVLLIASAVLMLNVYLDNNADQYSSLLERADMRLLFLCMILGITSWTGLCRYLRAESLKLREMDYIAAARSQGVGHMTILTRHILPNVMHIVLITVALDFSCLLYTSPSPRDRG